MARAWTIMRAVGRGVKKEATMGKFGAFVICVGMVAVLIILLAVLTDWTPTDVLAIVELFGMILGTLAGALLGFVGGKEVSEEERNSLKAQVARIERNLGPAEWAKANSG